MKLESEIQKEILHWLNSQRDIFAWKNSSTGIFSQGRWRKKQGFDIVGTSDILGILSPNGFLIAIEVKTEKGKLTIEQSAFLKKIEKMGGFSTCARSLTDVIEFIKTARTKTWTG